MTGFLLAGVGNVDLRRKTNFLVVNESELASPFWVDYYIFQASLEAELLDLIAVLTLNNEPYLHCFQRTVPHGAFSVAPVNVPAFSAAETTVKQIEDTFKDFATREDIAIVLINQFVRPRGCSS